MRALTIFALAGIVSAAPQPARPQEPGSVRESAEVSLVEVPVRVIGRDGLPVRGLTADAFSLEDDGRSQTIVGFDAVDLADRNPGAAGLSSPAARRRFLILFDLSFSQPKAIVFARKAARDFVLSGLGDRDLAAVATYSVEKGVRLLVTFTADRGPLARAVDTLGLEASRDSGDPLAFAFDREGSLPPGALPTSRPTGSRADVAGIIESLQSLSILRQMRDDEYARDRVRHLFQSFRELSQALDTVEGRKDVIYLSEGFRGRYLVGAPETEEERQYLIHGEVWKVDADKRFGSITLREELDGLGDVFRRSDCVIHAVDIAGIRAENDPDGEGASIGLRESGNALYEIAAGSGGEVFRNANDFGSELAQIVRQTSLVYVLAFRPGRPAEEGRFHSLKVKVSVPGARVLARAGYYDRRGFRRLSPLERRLVAADVIANEIPSDEIPARVLAVPFAGSGSEATVPVLLEIPGPALLEADRSEKLQVEVYAYAFDEQGRLADYFVRTLAADVSKSRERLLGGGVRYFGVLRLPPGAYRLRTLVRNASTGRMGFAAAPLQVPGFSAGEPYLLPPVFLERSDAWLTVGESGHGESAAEMPGLFAELPTEGMTPAVLGSVEPGAASRVCLVAYHFDAGDREELKLGSQILGADGQPLQTARLAVIGSTAARADGRRTLLLSFSAPPGLAPGRYGLRVFLQGAAGGATRQATAPFRVP